MKIFGRYIEKENYRAMYELACENNMAMEKAYSDMNLSKENECERLRAKVADCEYEINRTRLDYETLKTENEVLKMYLRKKTASEQLHDIAERLREAESKAELYDRYLKNKRERNRRYRARLKAAKR